MQMITPAGAPAGDTVVYIVHSQAGGRARFTRMLATPGRTLRTFATGSALLATAFADRPGCLLVEMPPDGRHSLAFQYRLRLLQIRLPLIFYCRGGTVAIAMHALKAGAFDFLTVPLRGSALPVSVELALALDGERRRAASWRLELQRRQRTLTPREDAVMTLALAGLVNPQMAQVLALSEVAVKVHRSNMMRKMAAATLVELVRMHAVLAPRAPDATGDPWHGRGAMRPGSLLWPP